MALAYISLGSNIEPRLDYLKQGLQALSQPPLRLTRYSSIYETEPVGYTDQAPFLNALAEVESPLSPEDLLKHLQGIEAAAHKKVPFRWGPRSLDLDLVLYGQETRDTPALLLPHPRMHERAFVLAPFCEVAPWAKHPGLNKTAKELLENLPQPQPKVLKVAQLSI